MLFALILAASARSEMLVSTDWLAAHLNDRHARDLFVLKMLGYEKLRNYYGAWEEWGNRDDLPIATKK